MEPGRATASGHGPSCATVARSAAAAVWWVDSFSLRNSGFGFTIFGMTWDQWQRWAKKHHKRTAWHFVLNVMPLGTEPELTEEIALDELIRQFAANPARWPRMTGHQRAMLYYRFDNATSLLSILGMSPLPAPEFSASMIEWLLVTSWRFHGEHHWSDFQSLCRHVGPLVARPIFPPDPEDGFAA